MPAEVSIYVEEFRNLVSFSALKPDFLLDKFIGTNQEVLKAGLTGALEDSG